METNWLQETVISGLTIHLRQEIQITNSGRGLQETGSSGRLDKSVDGLEESGCGTGPMNVPKIKWVTDAKVNHLVKEEEQESLAWMVGSGRTELRSLCNQNRFLLPHFLSFYGLCWTNECTRTWDRPEQCKHIVSDSSFYESVRKHSRYFRVKVYYGASHFVHNFIF